MNASNLQAVIRDLRRHGEYEAAAALLHGAIARSDDRRELADLYGMLGGTRRDQGNLVAAAAAYDTGATYESGQESTYNALNRLVTRIALDPDSLADAPQAVSSHPTLEAVDVPQGLADLQAKLIQNRRSGDDDDFWIAGDLALTAALNGDVEVEAEALERFHTLSPPAFAYTKYAETFALLAALDTHRQEALRSAQRWMESRAG